MAPASGQKGTGKKGAAVMQKQSRNSTPAPTSSLPPTKFYDPEFLNTRVILFNESLTFEDLVDHGSSTATVPESSSIDVMLDKLKNLSNIMDKRSTFYDRGMRYLADERKKRPDDYDRPRLDGDGDTKRSKHKRKKGSDPSGSQEGPDLSSPVKERKRKTSGASDSASSSLSPIAPKSPSAMDVDSKEKKEDKDDENEEEVSSEDEGAPPRREVPQSQTFGEDPSTFPDPTVYEIREVTPGMSEEEKKEIYSVEVYPKSDLQDLIAGDPPDKDFSNAKPSSQINFSTFSTYLEPYFRPFAEEDMAFLRERGERSTPFTIPKRGKRHYMDVWAE
jgi:transcriptional adapter 3